MQGQGNLFEYGQRKRITLAQPPADPIQTRAYVIEELEPFVDALERLELSPLAVAEAFAWYAGQFTEKAQDRLIE